jgi:integrase
VTKIKLKFVNVYTDRHGRTRRYFRRAGSPKIPLPGEPGSAEFMDAYAAALANEPIPPASLPIGAARTIPGSVSALIIDWYKSADFLQLGDQTKTTYRGIVERFRAQHGEKRVSKLESQHIRTIIAKRVETPAAANNLLRILRLLMRHAVETGMRRDDPTIGVRPLKHRSEGFHAWTDDEIATFEKAHPIGTRARLAMAVLIYTGARRGDVVKLGRQHIADGRISWVQGKTKGRVSIPIHPALAEVLETVPRDQMTFLLTGQGKPFTDAGFTNWFSETARAAGLPLGCSPHGLRKAAARRLAEAGCTANEIMAITGHSTLKEVTRYTASASREAMADSAMIKLELRPKQEQK